MDPQIIMTGMQFPSALWSIVGSLGFCFGFTTRKFGLISVFSSTFFPSSSKIISRQKTVRVFATCHAPDGKQLPTENKVSN